jgi:hypothetical protein
LRRRDAPHLEQFSIIKDIQRLQIQRLFNRSSRIVVAADG